MSAIGGAAITSYNLHISMLRRGVNSIYLVQENKARKEKVICQYNKRIAHIIFKINSKLDKLILQKYDKKKGLLFSPGQNKTNILSTIRKINPDIIHLHWINAGFIRIDDLLNLPMPIVWTLHDNWPFTGGCHIIPDNCTNYLKNCGNCIVLNSNESKDLSFQLWKKKKFIYSAKEITFIAPSNYVKSIAENSALLKNNTITIIPNGINSRIFSKKQRTICQNELFSAKYQNKIFLLFSAFNGIEDDNKGFKYLKNALDLLPKKIKDTIALVICGVELDRIIEIDDIETINMGIITNQEKMATIYNASICTIVASKKETFGLVAAESMSCGTPVVAFKTSGLIDIIDHKINGYLATPYLADDLMKGIIDVIENNYEYGIEAHNKSTNKFEEELIIQKHLKVYEDLLSLN